MKLQFEKFTKDDFLYYFQMVNNEKIMEFITGYAFNVEQAQTKFENLLQNNQLHPDFGSFKVIDLKTNEILGYAKLELEKTDSKEVELGYMLFPQHWGKGLATEISIQLIKLAKNHSNIKKVIAYIDPENEASKKILGKCGLHSKGIQISNEIISEKFELEFD